MTSTSPAGDQVQLVADHVRATVAQLERRIVARFGEPAGVPYYTPPKPPALNLR